ncbi:hypothetical protein BASA81_007969 [Batrachochytrium salamandrivorans]|nr:hypothetical protein BASA81_007969 [Batrachochytrium salamandrivorans]
MFRFAAKQAALGRAPRLNSAPKRRPLSNYYSPGGFRLPKGELALFGVIGANVAVALDWNFGFPLSLNQMHKHFLASTYYIFSPQSHLYLHTLFTSSISHIEPWHLFANMFTLYFFASDVFVRYGPRFALTLYVTAGGLSALAALAHARYVEHTHYRVLGASGAVCAFVTLNILLNPRQIVLVWFVLPVPAAVFGVGYILKEFWAAYLPLGVSGESHVSHLTGSAIGLLAWTGVRRLRV